jgi:hypothetical protein
VCGSFGCCGGLSDCCYGYCGKFFFPAFLLRRMERLKKLTITQAFLFDHDNRFFVGWKLDKSWILCTISWIVLLVDVVGITVAAKMLPAEDDYEAIPDRR